MDFGNKIIYKCPECGKLTGIYGLTSVNTYGITLYSDGFAHGMMYGEDAEIGKCPKCKTIYWLKEENIIGEYTPITINTKWSNAKEPEVLNEKDYIDVLNEKMYRNKEEEYYLRKCFWQVFNRKRFETEFTKEEKKIYDSNCKQLIKFCNMDNINDKLMVAEIYRNMGNFSECIAILETISKRDCLWIKKLFFNECKKENKNVIILIRRGERVEE